LGFALYATRVPSLSRVPLSHAGLTQLGGEGDESKNMRSLKHYTNRVYRKICRILGKPILPIQNRRLNNEAKKDPERLLEMIDASIGKGVEYFENEERISLEAIGGFTFMANYLLEPKLADLPLEENLKAYYLRCKDPHLRLFDKRYDPERDGARCPDEFDLNTLIGAEKPIVECLYADRRGFSEDYLDELIKIDDNGGYGTTHILLGCMILETFSDFSRELLNSVVLKTIAPIVSAQKYSLVEDIFYERIVFLLRTGYEEYVQPAWIIRMMNAQMKNGGWDWKNSPSAPRADHHPSSLAIAGLILYRERVIKKRNIVEISDKIKMGNIFSISTLSENCTKRE
jgi:hypothetical protein